MKIFAVIHNYGKTGKDSPMGTGEPAWYEMPDSSILRTGNPFFVPDFDTEFLAFPSICYRIGRLGKSIARRFADRYIDSATVAVAVVASNRLRDLREQGMPWAQATAFDRSCMLGNLVPVDTFIECGAIKIECGDSVMQYDLTRMHRHAGEIIEAISSDNTLKNGDLILAALPPEGMPLFPETRITAEQPDQNMKLIDINIK